MPKGSNQNDGVDYVRLPLDRGAAIEPCEDPPYRAAIVLATTGDNPGGGPRVSAEIPRDFTVEVPRGRKGTKVPEWSPASSSW